MTDDLLVTRDRYLVVKRQRISEDRTWAMCGQGKWIWTGGERDESSDVRLMRDSAR